MTIVVGNTTAPCPVCGGTGQSNNDSHRHATLPTVGRCNACRGTGRIAQAEHVAAGEEPSA